MNKVYDYMQALLQEKQLPLTPDRETLLMAFAMDETNNGLVEQILNSRQLLMNKWTIKTRTKDILEQYVTLPNAIAGRPYHALLDREKLGWTDLALFRCEGLPEAGLTYDAATGAITGTPHTNGDFKINIQFRVSGDEETAVHVKQVPFIINPDPKSLWKDLPSDREAIFWKEDNIASYDTLGEKHMVAASRRGRSHANVGSFRDDDYACRYFEQNGWAVVAVADGAGSAKLSREGSRIACSEVTNYFSGYWNETTEAMFDHLIHEYHTAAGEETQKKLNRLLYDALGKAALNSYKKIEEKAAEINAPIKDFHTTLIFTLFKKYDFGYAVLSFGVGDCPIGLLSKDLAEVSLMNWLDVGDYGGGTRFITMPEVFQSEKFSSRFRFRLIDDFSYLVLMTDGVYDPKFVVEANLEKAEKWQAFVDDLHGNNEENTAVSFAPGNEAIQEQLAAWMNFWSPGNHDDRTLAIIF